MSTLPLFGDDPLESTAWAPRKPELARKLQALAAERIWIGTSSWKYPGWLGQIYTPERYFTRGRFSQKKFEAECLAEYAGIFPIVCGDFSFYQFPGEAYWQKLFGSAPPGLRFAFKVPEEVTCRTFPAHARYGPRAGLENESFLNAEMLKQGFLKPLEQYGERVAVLIFEFGTFSRKSFEELPHFLELLDPFLAALPGNFRYSVEIRNSEFLEHPYFECLRRHGAAHVFSAWTRMPELRRQMALADVRTADFTVTRALLRFGRAYEQAVEKFSPYTHIQDPNPGAREAMRELIGRARKDKELAFLFVNNRLEGNAPGTIEAIVD